MPESSETYWDIIESYGSLYEEESMVLGEKAVFLIIKNNRGFTYCRVDYCKENGIDSHLPRLYGSLRESIWGEILANDC